VSKETIALEIEKESTEVRAEQADKSLIPRLFTATDLNISLVKRKTTLISNNNKCLFLLSWCTKLVRENII